jgi:transposase-like protein
MPAKPSDWIKRTAEANREALGESIDAWEPLLDKIGKALRKRAEQGNLSTPEQHKEAWLEVAEGLRRV